MPQLTLSLLGPPRLERDGVPINVDTRKAIALITYLAVTRQRHSRDALAALLWPENDQTSARAALRRTLSALNKALDGDWLDVDRDSVALPRRDDLWIDLDIFRDRLAETRKHGHAETDVCLACLAPLADAVALYQDDFMAGFSLRDSSNFDDWQFFQAEGLRRDLAGALDRLVHGVVKRGEYEAAIGYARRWLALDPLHEPAHRELMRLYAWAGQRAAAVHQYRECVRVLDQELGVPPLEATTQLYQAIKENQLTPPTPAWGSTGSQDDAHAPQTSLVPATVTQESLPRESANVPTSGGVEPASPQRYPLVGRAEELSALFAAYGTASRNGQLIVLEGEAGIGKTRLAEALLEHARQLGATAVATRCYEGEATLAYAPFTQALRTALSQSGHERRLETLPPHILSEACRLLPELGSLRLDIPTPAPLESPGAQLHFYEGVSRMLFDVATGVAPGVLVFDDLHWADAASLDLLTYLVRRVRDRQFCLVLTWRSDESSSAGRLRNLAAEMQRTGSTTVITLGRLREPDVVELVRSSGVQSLDQATGGRLYHETEGLPFFLVEYLTALSTGAQAMQSDQWTLPGGVRDLLRSRLHTVDETGWQLLNTAAVIGRSFDFETLREASGRSEEETVNGLETLIRQGVVKEVGATGDHTLVYDFSHEKLRSLVYEETSLARRRLLHKRVAEALISHARGLRGPGAVAGQIAYHYHLSGQESAAADYFFQAGEHARRLYANAEALSHYGAALALGNPHTVELHEAIGDVQTLIGDYSEAITSYEIAAALCEVCALSRIEHKLGNLHQRRGEWELAQSHFEAALAGVGPEGDPGDRARLFADWSLTAHMARGNGNRHARSADPAALAEQALALAEAAHDTRALAQVHNLLGVLARAERDFSRAQFHLEHSLRLADSLHDPGVRAAALNNLALAYGAGGEVERAVALEESALALCVAQGDRHREAALHNNLADLLYAGGRSEEAMEHLKQAVAIYSEIGVEAGAVQPEIWKLAEW